MFGFQRGGHKFGKAAIVRGVIMQDERDKPCKPDAEREKSQSSEDHSGSMYESVDNQEVEPEIDQKNGQESGEKKIDHPPDETDSARVELPKPPRIRKAPDLQPFERKNWLLYQHFSRKEFATCKVLIREQFEESGGKCRYAHYVKGLILRQEGDIQGALECFQEAAQLGGVNLTYLKEIGRCLFLLGKCKNAIEIFEETTPKDQAADSEHLYVKGMCYFHMGMFSEAKAALIDSVKASKNENAFALLGEIYRKDGELVKALEMFKKALELNPENVSLLTTLGLLYTKTDSFQQSFECLGKALTYDPCNARAVMAAGAMMQEHSDFDVALSKYRTAVHECPDSPQLWNNIAMCFYGKKKYVAAMSCLKRATYLCPCDWKIQANLGTVHLAMCQYASAFNFLSAARNLQPENAEIYSLLGLTLWKLQDPDNATQAFQRSLQINGSDPKTLLNYAMFLCEKEQIAEAKSVYEQLQAIMSNDENEPNLAKDAILAESQKLKQLLDTSRD